MAESVLQLDPCDNVLVALRPLKAGTIVRYGDHSCIVTEDIPAILWEGSEDNPDSWKDFVEMAKHAGALFVTISDVKLDREELDELIEEAGELNFPDEEASELIEAQWLQKYAGKVGYIQLGFVHQGVVFLHETTTEWYERYQEILEGIESFHDIVIDDSEGENEEL